MRIKLYPDEPTERALEGLQNDVRSAWNWLVKNLGSEAREAAVAWLIREHRVEPRPVRACLDGMTSEQSAATAEAHRRTVGDWWKRVTALLKEHKDECPTRSLAEWLQHFDLKQDYHLLDKVVGWHRGEREGVRPNAHMRQAIFKRFFQKGAPGARPKRHKRRQDHVPLQVRSGHCFALGDYGARRGRPFYDCQITINGLKIRGRLPGHAPQGRVLEGVAVVKEADGWWAAIKVEAVKRAPPQPCAGVVIGIDVGLDNIVAFDDGEVVPNTRDRALSDRVAAMQARGEPVGRLLQQQARHVRHVIYSTVFKKVCHAEVIAVEELSADIGQRGSRKISVMRTLVAMLQQRFGDRVREVPAAFTSQTCSQCKQVDKTSWDYFSGSFGKCGSCGLVLHRDVNAARNILHRALI